MDRIPGPQARQQIESYDGNMLFCREAVVDIAKEFIANIKKGHLCSTS
jgi:hypothetical protein